LGQYISSEENEVLWIWCLVNLFHITLDVFLFLYLYIFLCVYIFLLSFLLFFLFYIPSFTFIDYLLSIFLPLLSFFFPLFICFLSFWMEIMKNRDFHVFNLILAWVNDPHAGTVSSSQQFSKLGLNVGSIELDLSRGLSDDTCLMLYFFIFPGFYSLRLHGKVRTNHDSRNSGRLSKRPRKIWNVDPRSLTNWLLRNNISSQSIKMSIFYFENFILKKNFHCCYPAFHSLLAG
jgi:hypothetical protein